MEHLNAEITRADRSEITQLLEAVLKQYTLLFPEWEISLISISKQDDRNAQLDRMIAMLQNMKTAP